MRDEKTWLISQFSAHETQPPIGCKLTIVAWLEQHGYPDKHVRSWSKTIEIGGPQIEDKFELSIENEVIRVQFFLQIYSGFCWVEEDDPRECLYSDARLDSVFQNRGLADRLDMHCDQKGRFFGGVLRHDYIFDQTRPGILLRYHFWCNFGP